MTTNWITNMSDPHDDILGDDERAWVALADVRAKEDQAADDWHRAQEELDEAMSHDPTPARKDHRLAADVGGHPMIPLPVHWRMGAHGDPIAVFDHITLHLWHDGSVTWSDDSEAMEETR